MPPPVGAHLWAMLLLLVRLEPEYRPLVGSYREVAGAYRERVGVALRERDGGG